MFDSVNLLANFIRLHDASGIDHVVNLDHVTTIRKHGNNAAQIVCDSGTLLLVEMPVLERALMARFGLNSSSTAA
jgi:hypothetical protein